MTYRRAALGGLRKQFGCRWYNPQLLKQPQGVYQHPVFYNKPLDNPMNDRHLDCNDLTGRGNAIPDAAMSALVNALSHHQVRVSKHLLYNYVNVREGR